MIWKEEKLSLSWNKVIVIVIPLHKKVINQFVKIAVISLLNAAYKIFSKI